MLDLVITSLWTTEKHLDFFIIRFNPLLFTLFIIIIRQMVKNNASKVGTKSKTPKQTAKPILTSTLGLRKLILKKLKQKNLDPVKKNQSKYVHSQDSVKI